MSDAYVLDTNSFRVFGNYYPEIFPSFWEEIERLVTDEHVDSGELDVLKRECAKLHDESF
jgi:Domain of unknown function (DUF4411)